MGRIIHEYAPTEARALVDRWLAAFAPNGFGTLSRQYLWHIFSSGSTPALRGAEARAEYAAQTCAQYVVVANDRDKAFLTDSRPANSVLQDWFVFPPNLAWTMAFTHEDGWLGPYFARHPRHAALDIENAARLKKRREFELARERGWA